MTSHATTPRVAVKVCGITRAEDAALALSLGADFIGHILYAESPRGIALAQARALLDAVPGGQRVMVDVHPSAEDLARAQEAGFDTFQCHIDPSAPESLLASWERAVGRENLWLAPRLPSLRAFPEHILDYADTCLIDAFQKNAYGGSGQTVDPIAFATLKQAYPNTRFILAGGLGPATAVSALEASGATHIDINSAVETAPGIKDPAKLKALFRALEPFRS